MDVATLSMPTHEARRHLETYRKALARKTSAEYQAAATMYEQLALGRPVILLSQVMADAPRDAEGRPRLAVARSDRREVKYRRASWSQERESFDTDFMRRGGGRAPNDATVVVPVGGRVAPVDTLGRLHGREVVGYALVPLVPPDVAKGHDLSKRFTLFEVEAWAERPQLMQPDRDPYLLVRIAPDCYAVVGEWLLTDVERAVMRSRVSAR